MVKSSLEIAQLLVNSGADVNVMDNEGCAPLHAAAQSEYREVAELLLGSSASLDARNYDQETPLNLACAIGKLDMAHFLIDRGSDINSWDKDGFIPLHAASRWGHVDVAWVLLDCGSDVSTHEMQSWTAPHYASRHGHLDVDSRCLRHSHTPLRVIVANFRRSGSGALGRFNLSTIDIPLSIPSIPVFTVFTDGPEPAFSANVDVLLSTTERAWRIAWIAHVESFLGDLVMCRRRLPKFHIVLIRHFYSSMRSCKLRRHHASHPIFFLQNSAILLRASSHPPRQVYQVRLEANKMWTSSTEEDW
jgi:hypothetical protein